MRRHIFAIASYLVISAPLAAKADGVTPTPAIQPASTEPVICHYFYHEGMIIRRPDCRTQREWNRLRDETQRNISEIETRSLTMSEH